MSFNKAMSMRRKEKDIFKLRSAEYKVVAMEQDSTFNVEFKGPANTPYQKGKWNINLYLPEEYPYKSPSVGFLNKIYHPNIDFSSGSVCLDVINQTWTPMYELVNIFEIFLPQLLTYPNPASPLNHEAAELYDKCIQEYGAKVRELIQKYALSDEFKVEKIQSTEQKDSPEAKVETLPEMNEEKIDAGSQSNMQDDNSCSLSDGSSLRGQRDEQLNNY